MISLARHAQSSGASLVSFAWTARQQHDTFADAFAAGLARRLPQQRPAAKCRPHGCIHPCAALQTASFLLKSCRLTLCCALQSFEALNARAVAVVVDPIQSVKGKVVIDAFRWASEMRVLPAVQSVACSYTLHVKGALVMLDDRWSLMP